MTLQRKFPLSNPRRPIPNLVDQPYHSTPHNLLLHRLLLLTHPIPRPQSSKKPKILRRRNSERFSFGDEAALKREMGEIELERLVSTTLLIFSGFRSVERDHERYWGERRCERFLGRVGRCFWCVEGEGGELSEEGEGNRIIRECESTGETVQTAGNVEEG